MMVEKESDGDRKKYQTSLGARARRYAARCDKQETYHQQQLQQILVKAWAPLNEGQEQSL